LSAPSLWERLKSAFRPPAAPVNASRVYAGAEMSRLTQDWFAQILSATQEIVGDIRRLRGASRAYVRDDPYGTRFIKLVEENVVGHVGIQLQLQSKDKALNKRVEAAFNAWAAEPEWASADGRMSFCEVQQATMRAVPQDGFALVRHIKNADNPFGYSLQLLDADLLDHEYGQNAPIVLSNGHEIRLGVQTSPPYGRVVGYWLWNRHPSESGSAPRTRVFVAAEDLELLYIPTRTGQPLGVPWFAPVLFVSKMAGGMEEAAITAGRIGASSMAAITFDAEKAAGVTQAAPGQTTIPQEFEPGRFWRLGPGEGLTSLPLEYPSEAYGPFIENMRQSQAIGLNVAYASLTGNLKSVNYSSIRAGLVTERDSWRSIQHWLITHLHRRVFRHWATQAALNGVISAADAKAAIQFQTWKPRGWKWIDPQAEVQANALAVDHLFTTRSEIAAEQGLDFEDIVARQEEEEAMIVAAGLTVPGVSLGAVDTNNQSDNGEKEGGAPERQLRLARAR
jgi:lambda family phage portal protein